MSFAHAQEGFQAEDDLAAADEYDREDAEAQEVRPWDVEGQESECTTWASKSRRRMPRHGSDVYAVGGRVRDGTWVRCD